MSTKKKLADAQLLEENQDGKFEPCESLAGPVGKVACDQRQKRCDVVGPSIKEHQEQFGPGQHLVSFGYSEEEIEKEASLLRANIHSQRS